MNDARYTDVATEPEKNSVSCDTVRFYPEKPEKVYLYGTCLVDLFYPEAGMAAVKLLQSQGVDVVFPEQQSCCGQPAYTSGYNNQAQQVAKSQINCLSEQQWPVVILSGSCGGMLRHHYPALFKQQPEWEEKADNLASRVFEFTEFLVHVLHFQPEDLGSKEQVVLHTSCSARREMNVHRTCARLIEQCANVSLLKQEHEYECCGFGGTFAVRYPEISEAMVSDKVEALCAMQADRMVTADCGCLLNITGAVEYKNKNLRGEHIAVWLWNRVNLIPTNT